MIGTTVGSYTVTAKVSIGGMGTVYRAEHNLIGKQAAVKVLHPELRGNRDVVQRFFNEAKATTQIKHPGIVEVFDFGYLPSGDGYIVMEFLEGESLARRLKSTPIIDEGEAAFMMRGVCSALAAAHAKGIIHRDLKPDNIFLCPDPDSPIGERAKILDFGIAKLNVGLTGPGNATKTGAVMGTPTYMSPEQCKGTGDVDARADLYSIGCMYYECVAGRPPFDNMGAGELIGAHLYIEPVKPNACGAQVSEQAEQLIMSLLAKNPANRPPSAIELGKQFALLAQNFGLIARATPTAMRPQSKGDASSVLTPPPSATPATPAMTGSRTPATASLTPSRAKQSEAVLETLPSSEHISKVDLPSKPTTLSGAASQQLAVPRRRGLFIGIGAAIVLVSGSAVFFIVSNTKKPPAVTAPAPAAAPAPAPAPAPVAAPAPAPVAPVAAPTPPPVETPPPPVEAPPPVEKTPVAKKPDTKKPTEKKPTEKKPTEKKPTEKKPGDKKAGSGSGGMLIETDI